MDVGEDKYMSVLDYGLVKMRLKGDENREKVGFYNAPKYSYKAGKNGNFKTIICDMWYVVFDASNAMWNTPYAI